MTSKIIFNVTKDLYNILLLEDGHIVEFHQEKKSKTHIVGDIYLGTVERIAPGLNAAFVDIGQKKGAFLHYSDLSPAIRSMQAFTQQALKQADAPLSISQLELAPLTSKDGKIQDVLKEGEKVMVQVTKEVISTKGTRLSSLLSLAGRHLVLVPFNNEITISKKVVKASERERLRRLLESIRPHNFGIVARTVAEGKQVAELVADLEELKEKWEGGVKALAQAEDNKLLIKEISFSSSILRDTLSEKFDQLIVDDVDTYEEMKQYVKRIAPGKLDIIHLYQGKEGLFKYLGVEQALQNLFAEIVGLDGGGYLVIEQTEAMHVIDINTGSRITLEGGDTAQAVNLAATKELARQMRLRDMGGIICVDFIGALSSQHKREIYQSMREHIKGDRAKIEISPLSKRGIMEITRARVRPAVRLDNKEECPNCQGTGKVQPPILIARQLEEQISLLLGNEKMGGLTLYVHPFLYAYLQKGWLSRRWQWFLKYWKLIEIKPDEKMPLTTFKIFNKQRRLVATNPQLRRSKTPINRSYKPT